ncbi:MAG: metallophosphoesterase [Actinobacteria bacterium RBG_16_67_10]|nr:MAG: metallophosphoesterase [Actinobacteria bacterium RBG_16_67_10]
MLGVDGVLRPGPGEPHQVRTELAQAQVGREKRRRSLVVFHHFGDAQLLDEESPLRGEWQDSCPTPLSTAAFRPHETLTLQVAASLIRQANRIDRSPVTNRAVDFVLHTGNAADNAQYNELRWFIDLMDGRQVAPNSGGPGYEGVQSESPDQRYPDLPSLAQVPFKPQGCRYPWYTALGNRDVLVQGNFPPSDASRQIARGGKKIIDLSPARKHEVCEDPAILLDPERTQEILSDEDTEVRDVTPDEKRRLLTRADWVKEMFNSIERPGPRGHGLTQRNLDGDTAYYVFEHGPLAFIVLDTVNPGGFAAGSVDAAQFAWLEGEMKARSKRSFDAEGRLVDADVEDRLIVVVSHHPLERLNNPLPDASGHERVQGPALEELLRRFPNVIAHVTGGTLANSITPRPDPQGRGGGYWEVNTTWSVGYPMQGRLLEVVENADGTISLLSAVYDLDAAIDPRDAGDPTPGDDVNEGLLAAVARGLAARDPQMDPSAVGLAVSDRNAELLLTAPFDLSAVDTPPRHRAGPADEARKVRRRDLLRSLASFS